MRIGSSFVLIAVLATGSIRLASAADVDVSTGVRQIREGDLAAAVVTLDGVIQRGTDLAQAYLYKGVALVLLGQEEPAKVAFQSALSHQPDLRIAKGEQPDRVIRVFEAARTGKTKSVMERPSGAPRKAGMGAGTIGLITGAVLLAGGGAVAAVTSSTSPPEPPSPSPPPTANDGLSRYYGRYTITETLSATAPTACGSAGISGQTPIQIEGNDDGSNVVMTDFSAQEYIVGGTLQLRGTMSANGSFHVRGNAADGGHEITGQTDGTRIAGERRISVRFQVSGALPGTNICLWTFTGVR